MDVLRRLFGGGRVEEDVPPAPDPRQGVGVMLRLADAELSNEREQVAIYRLEDRLMRALDESGAGVHETNELERGYLRIQLLGADAERIVEVIRPLLRDAPRGSYLAVRRGPEGTSEVRVEIDDDEEARA